MDAKIIEQNRTWLDEVWEKTDKKLSRMAVKSRGKIPYTTTEDGEHNDYSINAPGWWTNGFWPGLMWLMYHGTGNEEYRKTAEISEELMDDALRDFDILHHDVGFMWHIMSGANYRLTSNKESRVRNLYAASVLASRYNIDGGYIQAWNGKAVKGWSIIDCMMNLALLYWASDEIGDSRFAKIALRHAEMSLRDHIRPDGSVNHIVEHDIETGEVVKVHGGQGYNASSCWSRGLAWAIYGSVISYVYTHHKQFLDAAIKTANYFIVHAKRTDYKTVVDFNAPLEPIYYDAAAGVCAACGILELSKYVSEAEAAVYTQEAINLLKATDKHFCDYSEKNDALVLMGTVEYPHKSMDGVHMPLIYSDFFFAEALLKLKGDDFFIW